MLTIYSFGFKRMQHVPGADVHIDCRPMRNPYHEPNLRHLDGRDTLVQEFVSNDRRYTDLLQKALLNLSEGKNVAFGCYGGHHRSVAMAEILARIAQSNLNLSTQVEHLSLK
jgi:UPF0042 nucleotide-binding protein